MRRESTYTNCIAKRRKCHSIGHIVAALVLLVLKVRSMARCHSLLTCGLFMSFYMFTTAWGARQCFASMITFVPINLN